MFDILSPRAVTGAPVNRPPAGLADEIAGLYEKVVDGSLRETLQEVHRITRAEKTMWIAVCHTPISFKGQAAIMSTFKDVTEIKEQQLSAQRAAELLNRENRMLRSSLKERYRLGGIIGRSRAMQGVYELILKAAATDASVAIYGESGTGKELVAFAIHLRLCQAVDRIEKTMIANALTQTGGNRSKAAALPGISRRALFRKISDR